ncbi:MAG: M14 family zinc carboxypeptidase [Victivallaceae bacterium]
MQNRVLAVAGALALAGEGMIGQAGGSELEQAGDVYRETRFPPCRIEGLVERPAWWKVRPREIIEACRQVKKGRAEVIAHTPLGFPVYAVFYGECPPVSGTANWSAGSSSDDPDAYFGKGARKPTVVWVAGFHGAEAEGVAGSMNLLSLLETGKDLRGRSRDSFLELASRFNLIIVPCLNMDGRAISPDHLNGVSYQDFRHVSQGSWADGTLIGWRGSKAWFPLPLERVAYPGGYPNSEGFNPMHDAEPGNIRTAEVRGLLNLVGRYGVDLLVNAHSYENAPAALPPGEERAFAVADAINRALFEAGLRTEPVLPMSQTARGVNFNTLVPLTSGGMAVTLESPVSQGYTFDQLAEITYVTIEAALGAELEKSPNERQSLLH